MHACSSWITYPGFKIIIGYYELVQMMIGTYFVCYITQLHIFAHRTANLLWTLIILSFKIYFSGPLAAIGKINVTLQENRITFSWMAPFSIFDPGNVIYYDVNIESNYEIIYTDVVGTTYYSGNFGSLHELVCAGLNLTITPINPAGLGEPRSVLLFHEGESIQELLLYWISSKIYILSVLLLKLTTLARIIVSKGMYKWI